MLSITMRNQMWGSIGLHGLSQSSIRNKITGEKPTSSIMIGRHVYKRLTVKHWDAIRKYCWAGKRQKCKTLSLQMGTWFLSQSINLLPVWATICQAVLWSVKKRSSFIPYSITTILGLKWIRSAWYRSLILWLVDKIPSINVSCEIMKGRKKKSGLLSLAKTQIEDKESA